MMAVISSASTSSGWSFVSRMTPSSINNSIQVSVLIGLLDYNSNLGDEFHPRATATGRSIVCTDRGSGPSKLFGKQSSLGRSRDHIDPLQYSKGKRFCSLF